MCRPSTTFNCPIVTFCVCVKERNLPQLVPKDSLLKSLPLLANTLVVGLFLFLIFGIVGTQLWNGKLYQRCFNTSTGSVMQSDLDDDLFCGTSNGRVCGLADGKNTINASDPNTWQFCGGMFLDCYAIGNANFSTTDTGYYSLLQSTLKIQDTASSTLTILGVQCLTFLSQSLLRAGQTKCTT